MLLRHPGPANRTTTGRFLESCFQSHQLETGTAYGILQQDYSNTAILTSETWLKRVWHELKEYSIHVEMDSPALQLRREGDRFLVELFMEAEVDQPTLKWLNWCRLFLHATTLSDITTADGNALDPLAWDGKRAAHSRSLYTWPRTIRPSEHWWRCWRATLRRILLNNNTSLKLSTPLGPWHDDIFSWNWVYSPSLNRLFRRHGHCWLECPELRSCTRSNYFVYKSFREIYDRSLPPDLCRATVRFRPKDRPVRGFEADLVQCFIEMTGFGSDCTPSPPTNLPSSILDTWKELQAQCDGHFGWVPESIKISGSEDSLLLALKENRIRIISDGSYKNGVGSAATQITTLDRRDTIWIRCQTPGLTADQGAYRSELIGILAGIQVASWLRARLKVRFRSSFRPSITLACDGKAALDNAFDTWTLKATAKQFDLISAIREAIRLSFITWLPRHVKGHQDDQTPKNRLSWWALRNIECDARAKRYRQRLVRSNRSLASNPRFFTEPSSLFISSVKQSRLRPDHIMELVTLPPLLAYWDRRGRLNSLARAEILWDRVERTMKTLPSGLQRWTTKHAVSMCSIGKWKVRWKWSPHDHCPRCKAPEDHLHIPCCPAESAQTEWDDRVANFHTWMRTNSTAPEIQVALLWFLSCVCGPIALQQQLDHYIYSCHPVLLRQAVLSQKTIGVQCMLEGLLSCHWAHLQTLHYQSINSQRSGNVWYSQASAQLIWIGFHMWQHRNGVQHSGDNLQLQDRHRDANFAIREQFELGIQDLPPHSHRMLRRPRLEVLRLPLDDKERWVRLLRGERRLLRQTLERQRRLMRQHFPVLRRVARRARPRPEPPTLLGPTHPGFILESPLTPVSLHILCLHNFIFAASSGRISLSLKI